MKPGNLLVETDHGDVVLVWAPFEGRPTRITLQPDAALGLVGDLTKAVVELGEL